MSDISLPLAFLFVILLLGSDTGFCVMAQLWFLSLRGIR